MQTLRFSNTSSVASNKVIQAKEKFVSKLVDAIATENNITSVIGSTKVDPDSNLLLRFVSGVNDQYKTTANKLVLDQMLQTAASDLYRLKLEKSNGPVKTIKTKNYISIGFRNGVIRPKVWPDFTDDYQWELKTKFQPWAPIGAPGTISVFPGVSEGNVCLTYKNLRSNVVSISSVIKRQIGATKRKPYRLGQEDPEFITRCKSVASRILRLCNPRILGTAFNMDAAHFSMRIFEDRVSRLPKHLGLDSEEIIQLCIESDTDDDTFIRMVEFCEPTIHLNPTARRREIREISSGNRLELRLGSETSSETKQQAVAAMTVSAATRRSRRIIKAAKIAKQREEQAAAEAADAAAAADLARQQQEAADKAAEEARVAVEEERIATQLRQAAEEQTRLAEEKARKEAADLLVQQQEEERLEQARIQAEQDAKRLKDEELRLQAAAEAERLRKLEEEAAELARQQQEAADKAAEEASKAAEQEKERERIEKERLEQAAAAQKLAEEAAAAEAAAAEAAAEAAAAAAAEKQQQIDAWQAKVDELKPLDKILINEKFDSLDTNGDGSISVSELSAAYQTTSGGQRLKNLVTSASALRMYDGNGDNSITRDEFAYWCVDSDAVSIWATTEIDGYEFASQRPDNGEVVYFKTMLGTWERQSGKNFFIPNSANQSYKVTGNYLANHWVQTKREDDVSGSDEDEESGSGQSDEEETVAPRRSARLAASPPTNNSLDELDEAIFNQQNSQIPSGDLTSMVANMSDDWAESDEELNFAEDSDTGDTGSMEFAESSQQEDSGSMEFAESSSLETDSDVPDVAEQSTTNSSAMEFAESSAVESESDKVSSEAAFAESSDYD